MDLLQNIDPTLLLAVFLPVLLFGSAFAAHWHTVRRQKWGILLLAFPGEIQTIPDADTWQKPFSET